MQPDRRRVFRSAEVIAVCEVIYNDRVASIVYKILVFIDLFVTKKLVDDASRKMFVLTVGSYSFSLQ